MHCLRIERLWRDECPDLVLLHYPSDLRKIGAENGHTALDEVGDSVRESIVVVKSSVLKQGKSEIGMWCQRMKLTGF